jgi:hypothetical protein
VEELGAKFVIDSALWQRANADDKWDKIQSADGCGQGRLGSLYLTG